MVVHVKNVLMSNMYMHRVDDFVYFVCLDDSLNRPLMIQLDTSRATIVDREVFFEPVRSEMQIFEDQARAILDPDYVSITSNALIATINKDVCRWFSEANEQLKSAQIAKIAHSTFTCVPILAIHGFSLKDMKIKYEVIQMKHIEFKIPTLPDLSSPLFI